LPLAGQLESIFGLAAKTLAEDGLGMNDVIYIIAELVDMHDRPIVNNAQKRIWTSPEHYPCRIILERGGFKAGARVRLLFTATKAPHRQVNSAKGQMPTGPFSRSAVVGRRVYGSGVRPIIPGTQTIVSEDFKECARQCLRNLATNMEESGASLEKAYSFTTYLPDLANVGLVMEVFAEYGISGNGMELSFEKVDALNECHPVEIACNANL
jgi:enamine deaminase RidA (YjgF/YER057c/UK114 family)